jgi:Protein of unknown function (DUF3667)
MDVGAVNHQLPAAGGSRPAACPNCGSPLKGRYCSNCGQRADTHAHSVRHFFHEFAEAMTHADSRVWGTLLPLVRRPGLLTREYFAGRRARYLEPLRVYLFMSVLFLVLSAAFSGGGPGKHVNVQVDKPKSAAECANLHTDLRWGGKALLPRLKAACLNIVADNGQQFGESMVHNIGRAMFVFLPLMAALMKLLYWRPRHYYLEHLVLLLHNHACVFLLLSLFLLALHWFGGGNWNGLVGLALCWYLVRYLYRSMKIVYGQGGWLTLLKFSVLAWAYVACGSIMLLATAFISAATL